MKAQQLNAKAGVFTELQVIQNTQLTLARVGQSAIQKKILKMQDDPTMCMKTQGRATECHSQFCDFEGGVTRVCSVCPLTIHRARSALHGAVGLFI